MSESPSLPAGALGGNVLAPSDQDLVRAFQEGDEKAFDQLVRRHMERAIQIAYVAVGNFEDAKDVSQEACVKAYRALRGFQMRSTFSTWLYRVVMNAAKDFLRRRRWKTLLTWKSPEAMGSFFEQVADARADASEGARRHEFDRAVTHAIRALPLRQRWAFTLRFLEGLSIHEVSEAMGVAEGTVKATLHAAGLKFKRDLMPFLGEGGLTHESG